MNHVNNAAGDDIAGDNAFAPKNTNTNTDNIEHGIPRSPFERPNHQSDARLSVLPLRYLSQPLDGSDLVRSFRKANALSPDSSDRLYGYRRRAGAGENGDGGGDDDGHLQFNNNNDINT